MPAHFRTLTDLMAAFRDHQLAIEYLEALRWPDGTTCPFCANSDNAYTSSGKNVYRCVKCRRNFSVLVGTIFEDTKLPLRIWLGAIWLVTDGSKRATSASFARDLGITQRSAWFILHRLRHAARTRSFNQQPNNSVEVGISAVGHESSSHRKDRSASRDGSTT